EELQLLKLITYQLPRPSLEVEKFLLLRAKGFLADFEFSRYFSQLLRLHLLTCDYQGKKAASTPLVEDVCRFLRDTLLNLLLRARCNLQQILLIGKRNQFAQHLWSAFLTGFRNLLLSVSENRASDVNLFFLYPALQRFREHFEKQQSIYTVSLESLRNVHGMLRVCEWCHALQLAQTFCPESCRKIDEYMNLKLEDSLEITRAGGDLGDLGSAGVASG
ncbi:unnamed protein product, partial [Amoebophrya sp. A25]